MKKLLLSAGALVASASAALAGGMAPAIVEMPVEDIEVVAESSSSAGLIIPLILIALIAAAMSSSESTGN
ncbi:ferrochelatase [Marivivens marinus]|uniref:ferrochelatase n=1 Tax=Marivivens marinus TaxID=3110173 RepID=UPI003B84A8CE